MSADPLICPAVADTVRRMEAAAGASGAVGCGPSSAKGRVSAQRAPRPKKGSKAAKRAFALRLHRAVRWAVQILFFLVAPALFSAAFNGVKHLFTQIGARQAIEPTSFVVLLVAVLAFTVLFGRFFCGYACAFGTLGDAVYLLFTPVRRVLHVADRPVSERLQRRLQLGKFGVLVAICALCFAGLWPAISGYSPWTAFAGLVAFNVDGIDLVAFAVLGGIVVGMALVKRFFCQFLCPLGAVFALMPVVPASAYNRDAGRCSSRCGHCKAGCPVAVFPDADALTAGECIACGKCADVCPTENVGVLSVKSRDPKAAERKPQRVVLRGNEVPYVALKAALLLAVCWVAGALSFGPAFTDVTGIVLPWA